MLPKWAWVVPGAFWVVWMLNLYNFMDGIDGLAGGEAAVASSFFFLVFAWYGQSGWAGANLVVAAASMGFVLPFAPVVDTTGKGKGVENGPFSICGY